MELRSHNHYHFIRAIRGGSIERVLNVDTRRMPKLNYKELEDIYEKHDRSHSKIQPRVVRNNESEDYGVESEASVHERDGICDDLGIGDIKLGQILKQCRANKRKHQNCRHAEMKNSNSGVKQEHSTLEPEDDVYDHEEPLCDLTTRSRKMRNDFSMLLDVEIQSWEKCFPDSDSDSGFIFSIPVERLAECVEEANNDASTEFHDTMGQAECCEVVRVALEIQEHTGPHNASNFGVYGDETSSLADSSEETGPRVQGECCVVDKYAPENQENAGPECKGGVDPKPSLGMKVTGWEIVKVGSPEILAVDYSGLPVVDFGKENNLIGALSYNLYETDCSEGSYHRERNLLICSTNNLSLSGGPGRKLQEHEIDQTGHFLPHCDSRIAESSSDGEDVAKNHWRIAPESGHGLRSWDLRKDESSSEAECIAKGILSESSSAFETDSIPQQKIHHPPEKLLSHRKVISPTSQARLCKAMEQLGLPEKTNNKCKGKLDFAGQAARRVLKAERLGDIERVEATPNLKQGIKKQNIYRQKASSKVSRRNNRASTPVGRFSTGCNSIQVCSQNAIAFSQRQMHDIQKVATKLTDELKYMKEVTQKCLQTEYSSSKLSKRRVDEVKIAISNAERAQEIARKWLSMMERDCNRFCKLMGMISEDSPATENISPKKRKRVSFADDAGGDLCHVKLYEVDLESPSLSQP